MRLSEKKTQLAYTVITNLLLQLITALCGFILPPLIVQFFGSSVNGMVASINQFIAYLNLVEAGVGGATIAALYKPLAEGNVKSRNQILSAAHKFYNRSGVFFALLIVALSFLYPLLVATQVSKTDASLLVLILGMTGVGEFFLIGKYRVLLTADRRLAVFSLIQTFAIILNTLCGVVLIKAGFGILAVKLASSLVFLARYFPLMIYAKRKYKDLDFKDEPDTEAISQSRNVMVHQIGGLVVFNSPIVILTIFCTLKDVSIYSVYTMVFVALKLLISSFSNGFEAFLGAELFKKDITSTQRNFAKYEIFFFMLIFWAYSLAAVLCIPFMQIYTKNMTDAQYIQPTLAFLFVLVGLFDNLRKPGDKLIAAAGHFKQTQWRSLTEVGINLTASITFTVLFGLKGVLLGAICSFAYRTFDIIHYSSKHIIKTPFIKSLTKILLYVPFAALLIFVTLRLDVQVHSFSQWVLYALALGIVYGLCLGAVALLQAKREKLL